MFSRFQKVLKTLEMILAWFYTGTRSGIIGEPLRRLQRSSLEVISGLGAIGALPLIRGLSDSFISGSLHVALNIYSPPFVPSFILSFLSHLLPLSSQEVVCGTRVKLLRGSIVVETV